MGNERRFAGINTKIRVLKSRLLKNQDYINLMEKKNVSEQVIYLRDNTVYHELLQNIVNPNDIQQVEFELKRYIIFQFEKIIRYFSNDYERFYRALMLRYEVEDLKVYLRAIGRQEEITNKIQFVKDNHYKVDVDKILKSNNLDEFIENLKGTIYYDALKPYKNEDDDKIIFHMEMNLDRLYFRTLKMTSEDLGNVDRKIFENILGENVDLLNIEWIYRGIKFYDLLPEELINYTLPYGSIFGYKELKEMCYSTEEKLIEIVLDSQYALLFKEKKDIDLYMEINIKRYLYEKFTNTFKKGKLDLGISLAYIHLLEFEIKDIISILESKKYEISLPDTIGYLVRKIKGSDI